MEKVKSKNRFETIKEKLDHIKSVASSKETKQTIANGTGKVLGSVANVTNLIMYTVTAATLGIKDGVTEAWEDNKKAKSDEKS